MIRAGALALLLALATAAASAPAWAQDEDDFTLAFRAQAMIDAGGVSQRKHPAGQDYNSGAVLRRAQVNFGGNLSHGWSYSLGGVLATRGSQSGTRFTGSVEYQHENSFGFRAGVFSAPSGMGGNTNAVSELMLERPSAVTIARSTAASPSRIAFSGFTQGPRHLVALSVTGGSIGAGGRYDNQQAVVFRAAGLVVSNDDLSWALDAAASHVFRLHDTAGPGSGVVRLRESPEMALDVTRTIDTGNLDARALTNWNMETGLAWRSAYLQGGFFSYHVTRRAAVPDPTFHGWYVQGSWILTGERRTYNPDTANFRPPTPAAPLGKGGWGALELTARYSGADLNGAGGVSGGRQEIFAVGVNWYQTSRVRFSLVYDRYDINHPAAPAGDFAGDAMVLRAQYAM
jgi:phosphate-selective porin OprO/OprP